MGLYADVGRLIVSRQEAETWGKSVVANLAGLAGGVPRVRLGSPRLTNRWRMKLFHETYGADEKLARWCEKLRGRTMW